MIIILNIQIKVLFKIKKLCNTGLSKFPANLAQKEYFRHSVFSLKFDPKTINQ